MQNVEQEPKMTIVRRIIAEEQLKWARRPTQSAEELAENRHKIEALDSLLERIHEELYSEEVR